MCCSRSLFMGQLLFHPSVQQYCFETYLYWHSGSWLYLWDHGKIGLISPLILYPAWNAPLSLILVWDLPCSGSWEVSTVMQPGVWRAAVWLESHYALSFHDKDMPRLVHRSQDRWERPAEVSGRCQPPKPIRRSAVNYLSGTWASWQILAYHLQSQPKLLACTCVS